MNGQKDLHLTRLRESLHAMKVFRDNGVNAFDSDFKTWKERTKQSLSELFGKDHDYVRRFSGLQFWDVRVMVAMRPGSLRQWSQRDQDIFDNDLETARNVISDALEEAPVLPDEGSRTATAPSPSPRVVVNVTNVLSQTTHVELKQVFSTLDSMGLPAIELNEAKRHAKELSEEAQGQQRWTVLAKSLDGLKSLGKSVYENVALPLLLEMLKKQTGIDS